MRPYLIAYVAALVAFAAIDMSWLKFMGPILYLDTLSDILAPEIRIGPAAVFYTAYPAGVVYFAVHPALTSGTMKTASFNGALFGMFAYGTYELTNFATLRSWTLDIVVIDIVYGAIAGLAVATVSYIVASKQTGRAAV